MTTSCTPFPKQQMYTWLYDLPHVSYQSQDRAIAVMRAVCATQSMSDRLTHYFLALLPSFSTTNPCRSANPSSVIEIPDVFICWVLTSGKVFAVDAKNQSALSIESVQCGPRWAPTVLVLDVIEIAHAFSEQIRESLPLVCQRLTTPYYIGGTYSQKSEPAEYIGAHLATSLIGILNLRCHRDEPDCPDCQEAAPTSVEQDETEVSDPALPSLSATEQVLVPDERDERGDRDEFDVTITIKDDATGDLPNVAIVEIASSSSCMTRPARSLMAIDQVYDAMHATGRCGLELKFQTGSCVFQVSSRMIRQLALLRAWAESRVKCDFQLEADAEDLPITIVHE